MKVVDGIRYASKPNGWALSSNSSNHNSHVIIPNEIDDQPIIEIENHAFSDREELETIEIPNTVQCIGKYAFSDCSNLKTVIERKTNFKLPHQTLLLRDGAFIDCRNLERVLFNKWITLAGKSVFRRCHHLEHIGFDNRIYGTRVPNLCFQACISLEHLTFMSKSIELGNNVFNWCTSLKTLTFLAEKVDCDDEDTWISLKNKKIICPATCNLANLAYEGVDIQIDSA
jgi:hypothetical protein